MTKLEFYKAELERTNAARKILLPPTVSATQKPSIEHLTTENSAETTLSNQTSAVQNQSMPPVTTALSANQTEAAERNQISPISAQDSIEKMEILQRKLEQAESKIQFLESENENYRIEAEVLEAESQMISESLEEALSRAKTAESRINHLSNQLTRQSKPPSGENQMMSRRLLRWKQRLASNPMRIWRKLKLPEQHLPRFGTIEQTTKQLAADKKLQERRSRRRRS